MGDGGCLKNREGTAHQEEAAFSMLAQLRKRSQSIKNSPHSALTSPSSHFDPGITTFSEMGQIVGNSR